MELKRINGSPYWVDSDGNMWNYGVCNEEQAEKHSKSLVDCMNCRNCRNCRHSNFCDDCENCDRCSMCVECRSLYLCTGCVKCSNCSYVHGSDTCNDCDHCVSCRSMKSCSYCRLSSGCSNVGNKEEEQMCGLFGVSDIQQVPFVSVHAEGSHVYAYPDGSLKTYQPRHPDSVGVVDKKFIALARTFMKAVESHIVKVWNADA